MMINDWREERLKNALHAYKPETWPSRYSSVVIACEHDETSDTVDEAVASLVRDLDEDDIKRYTSGEIPGDTRIEVGWLTIPVMWCDYLPDAGELARQFIDRNGPTFSDDDDGVMEHIEEELTKALSAGVNELRERDCSAYYRSSNQMIYITAAELIEAIDD